MIPIDSVYANKLQEDMDLPKESIFNDILIRLITAESNGNLCIPIPSEEKSILSQVKSSGFRIQEYQGEDLLYFSKTYEAKIGLEESFKQLILLNEKSVISGQRESKVSEIEKILVELENKRTNFKLKPGQKQAIIESVLNPFHIITGGPGTGKTTVVAFLLEVLQRLGELPPIEKISLTAPTGRAAQRLTESIQENLSAIDSGLIRSERPLQGITIHRLLEFKPYLNGFYYNIDRYMPYRFVLVDEVSMVDIFLMQSLLSALPDFQEVPFRLIFLGDKNQLPSVEKGSVLSDILTTIKKQILGCNPQFRVSNGKNNSNTSEPDFKLSELVSKTISELTESNRHKTGPGQKKSPILLLAESILNAEKADFDSLEYQTIHGIEKNYFKRNSYKTIGKEPEISWILPNDSEFKDIQSNDPLKNSKIRDLSLEFIWKGTIKTQLERIQKWEDFSTEISDSTDYIKQFQNELLEQKILTVYRRGYYGTSGLQKKINQFTKDYFKKNQSLNRIEIGERNYYKGLPILITQNDPSRKLFNGDIGIVLPDSQSSELRAVFLIENRLHNFALDTLPEHEEAYFLTVHKSQGSEYRHVLLYLPPMDSKISDEKDISLLLNRQILYTGVTRAKETIRLLGHEDSWLYGIKTPLERRTGFHIEFSS